MEKCYINRVKKTQNGICLDPYFTFHIIPYKTFRSGYSILLSPMIDACSLMEASSCAILMFEPLKERSQIAPGSSFVLSFQDLHTATRTILGYKEENNYFVVFCKKLLYRNRKWYVYTCIYLYLFTYSYCKLTISFGQFHHN